jgi:predicted O-methyltransferase YrrM
MRERLAVALAHNRQLVGLPPRVARFYRRARRLAARRDDEWSLRSVTKPSSLKTLLRLARGRRRVVEIGTGTAWTAVALALADKDRRVVTFDPVVWPQRGSYLDLGGDEARERITLVEGPGEEGAADREEPVDFLFVDGSHERARTIATFQAWRPHLAPGAVVAFHDWGSAEYPEVTEAIRELGIDGEPAGELFVWRAP